MSAVFLEDGKSEALPLKNGRRFNEDKKMPSQCEEKKSLAIQSWRARGPVDSRKQHRRVSVSARIFNNGRQQIGIALGVLAMQISVGGIP